MKRGSLSSQQVHDKIIALLLESEEASDASTQVLVRAAFNFLALKGATNNARREKIVRAAVDERVQSINSHEYITQSLLDHGS